MIKFPQVERNQDDSYMIHGTTGVYGNRAYVVEGAGLLEVWAAYWEHMRYVGRCHCESLLREVEHVGFDPASGPDKTVHHMMTGNPEPVKAEYRERRFTAAFEPEGNDNGQPSSVLPEKKV